MKKTNINITNHTTIEAYGTHTNGNSKKVYIVEMNKVCTSMTDAAEIIGCSLDAVSNTIRGKQRTCYGYHIIDLSKAGEAFPQMVSCLSEINAHHTKRKAQATEMTKEEVKEFRKWKAEKVAKQKAEEKARKRAERKAKALNQAEMEVMKYEKKCQSAEAKCTHFQAQLDKNTVKLLKAQEKLRVLKGGDAEC